VKKTKAMKKQTVPDWITPDWDKQSPSEEIASSIVHGIGVALSIAGLVILVVYASLFGDAWRVVSLSIYGTTLIILYSISTLFHGFRKPGIKRFFRLLDLSAIYLLIAGSYTPLTLISMRGPWGWTLFGMIWGMAIGGIVFKMTFRERFELVSFGVYLVMGWLILIAIKPLVEMLPSGMVLWLFIGGASYMLGLLFYILRKIPFHHTLWHLFVLGGSISHFFGMLFYLTKK
jgi:hemolysin III